MSLAEATPEQVDAVDNEVIFQLFGKDLSMGKGQGLIGMLELVQHSCRERLVQRRMRAEGRLTSPRPLTR